MKGWLLGIEILELSGILKSMHFWRRPCTLRCTANWFEKYQQRPTEHNFVSKMLPCLGQSCRWHRRQIQRRCRQWGTCSCSGKVSVSDMIAIKLIATLSSCFRATFENKTLFVRSNCHKELTMRIREEIWLPRAARMVWPFAGRRWLAWSNPCWSLLDLQQDASWTMRVCRPSFPPPLCTLHPKSPVISITIWDTSTKKNGIRNGSGGRSRHLHAKNWTMVCVAWTQRVGELQWKLWNATHRNKANDFQSWTF